MSAPAPKYRCWSATNGAVDRPSQVVIASMVPAPPGRAGARAGGVGCVAVIGQRIERVLLAATGVGRERRGGGEEHHVPSHRQSRSTRL